MNSWQNTQQSHPIHFTPSQQSPILYWTPPCYFGGSHCQLQSAWETSIHHELAKPADILQNRIMADYDLSCLLAVYPSMHSWYDDYHVIINNIVLTILYCQIISSGIRHYTQHEVLVFFESEFQQYIFDAYHLTIWNVFQQHISHIRSSSCIVKGNYIQFT